MTDTLRNEDSDLRMRTPTFVEQIEDTRSLAQVIVGAVREPLLVLDTDLRILIASASFHRLFKLGPESTLNRKLLSLDDGAWDFPALNRLLDRVQGEGAPIEDFEVAHDFPRIGQRILLLDASRTTVGRDAQATILIGFEDVTRLRAVDLEKARLKKQTGDLLEQKELMVREMQHRIVNSLQIIASILMLKARSVSSEETRQHLQDAHRRVMSVAAVQQHLHTSLNADRIEIGPYLEKLCGSLSDSMIGESRPATLNVEYDKGDLSSTEAVSVGLIVTELVINALKYAFPDPIASAMVKVHYEVNGAAWRLSVSDNGMGKVNEGAIRGKGGLGTSLVNALANQLDAKVVSANGPVGLSVAVTHATFEARPEAA